jgi:hypothetical protein
VVVLLGAVSVIVLVAAHGAAKYVEEPVRAKLSSVFLSRRAPSVV